MLIAKLIEFNQTLQVINLLYILERNRHIQHIMSIYIRRRGKIVKQTSFLESEDNIGIRIVTSCEEQ